MVMSMPADENPYIIWDFKLPRRDWSQKFMNTTKTMEWLVYTRIYK